MVKSNTARIKRFTIDLLRREDILKPDYALLLTFTDGRVWDAVLGRFVESGEVEGCANKVTLPYNFRDADLYGLSKEDNERLLRLQSEKSERVWSRE